MRPYNDIHIGDQYQRPLLNSVWTVVNKDDKSKMVEVRSSYQHPSLPETIWKKPSDALFNNRIGVAFGAELDAAKAKISKLSKENKISIVHYILNGLDYDSFQNILKNYK